MKWQGRAESDNVEDRRGMGKKAGMAGGGILVVLIAAFFGINPDALQMFFGGQNAGQRQARQATPEEEQMAKFSKVIFHDTEVIWDEQFRQLGKTYRKPTLVLFTDYVQSGCGTADSAVGPFYCPADEKVYIDLSFYSDMERKLDAPGEFARAYVIAHEVGHHVQRLLGYSKKVEDAKQWASKVEKNNLSVRLELQADYLAGVWAHHGQKKYKFLEEGDIQSALNAAFQIGDDRLQKRSRGVVEEDSFTHGSSKQRMRWFTKGYRTGDVRAASELFTLDYDDL